MRLPTTGRAAIVSYTRRASDRSLTLATEDADACRSKRGQAGGSLASGGLIAFYLAVVVGIGRSIRSVLGGTRYRLMVDEMPDTRDLIDLCEGVYIARREKRLMRETQLTELILRLFRSSETLLQLTGSQLKRHGE